jgi:ankyrin repeat protein
LELRAAEVLVKHGANIHLQNNKRQTALHLASQCGRLDITRLLLENGANVDARDNDGSTPLHLIIFKAHSEMYRESLHPDAYHHFVPSFQYKVIELLLEHGASGHRENNQGETPFQAAEVRGLQEITELLSMYIQGERSASRARKRHPGRANGLA